MNVSVDLDVGSVVGLPLGKPTPHFIAPVAPVETQLGFTALVRFGKNHILSNLNWSLVVHNLVRGLNFSFSIELLLRVPGGMFHKHCAGILYGLVQLFFARLCWQGSVVSDQHTTSVIRKVVCRIDCAGSAFSRLRA